MVRPCVWTAVLPVIRRSLPGSSGGTSVGGTQAGTPDFANPGANSSILPDAVLKRSPSSRLSQISPSLSAISPVASKSSSE